MPELLSRLQSALADRYRLDREAGAGGMATVYLAQDIRHDRRVAVKVLRPELAAVIGAERFLAEIKLTANLQHPHIKPENILLHDGQALVADFGIALAASKAGGSRMTETGMSLGTPHYMSPEQAMGEREITARSDVYALGAVLYELLTGDPPFTGSTAQAVVARVVTETPRPMLPQRHTIPRHVEAAVLTALEKLPADRFATAAEFAEALGDKGYSTGAATVAVAAGAAGAAAGAGPAGRRAGVI